MILMELDDFNTGFQEIKALPIKIVYSRATVTESRGNRTVDDDCT